MKQWQLRDDAGAGLDRLQPVEVPDPRPEAGEVVVRVRAASLNYRDLLIGRGEAPSKPNVVPLSDGAGEVESIGEGVTSWKPGDRVAGTFFRDWISGRFSMRHHDAALGGSVDGMLSERVVLPEHAFVRLPEGFSFEDGATLPCAGLTAWYALQRGGYAPGDSVLLLGTGGVSVWGLQIVAASGGTAIITSSSDDKLERARQMGASGTINYRTTPDWADAVRTLTDGRGVDHILEVGGPGTLPQSLKSVAAGGHIALIGVLTGFGAPGASLFPLVSQNATMSGIYVGDRENFESFVRFLNATKIKPVVDRTFGFDGARAAFDYMASGAHFGKVVVTVSGE